MARSKRRTIVSEDEGSGNAALSFLDIVSAGFGGAIFLLVVFITLPIATEGGGGGGSTRYISIALNWPSIRLSNGTEAWPLIELQIEHNKTRISTMYIDPDPDHDILPPLRQRWKMAILSGFDASNRYHAIGENAEREVQLRIVDPQSGEWNFYVNVFSYVDSQNRRIPADLLPPSREVRVSYRIAYSGMAATRGERLDLIAIGLPGAVPKSFPASPIVIPPR